LIEFSSAVLGILLLSGDTKEDLVELPEEGEGIVTTWQPVQNGGANELPTSNDDFCGESSCGLGQEEVDGPPAPSLIWDGQEWLRNVEINKRGSNPLPLKRFKKWKKLWDHVGNNFFLFKNIYL
jgi:hypothetical protein